MDSQQYSSLIDNIYSSGITMMLMGLGKRTGLFKALCESDKPLTSQEVADITNQKERYVREWLNGMAAARIVELDVDRGCYFLTEVQRKILPSKSAFSDVPYMVAMREPLLRECFKKDGPYGINFAEQPAYFDWVHTFRTNMVDRALETEMVPALASQGLTAKLESGVKVADIGCGEGSYTLGLARCFPNSSFTGVDISERAVAIATKGKEEKGLTNVTFETGNAELMSEAWEKQYDIVFMYDVLHDLPNPHRVLQEIHRILKDGGYFTMMEMRFHANPADNVGNPAAALCYGMSTFVCLPSSLSAPPHIGYGAVWGTENVEKALEDSKFTVLYKALPDIVPVIKVFYICRKHD